MKKILLILIFVCILSCQKDKEFKLPNLSKIEFVSYPDRMIWDTIGAKGEKLFYKNLIVNSKLNFDSTMIKERVILKSEQLKELSMLLQETCDDQYEASACYMPRNLILFRDNKDKIIAYKEFCFSCSGSYSSKNIEKYSEFCLKDMNSLFRKFGIKYFGDTPEQVREESKFIDSIFKARGIR
jgi:hypothetical protein